MWIWQNPDWPRLGFDALALQPALAAARVAQGRMLGLASQLQLLELSELQIDGISAEAIATAQIEGEVLHLQSVRLSAARRLGLAAAKTAKPPTSGVVRKNFKQDHRAPPREEATLDVIEAAISQWQKPLTSSGLLGWHAMLFPTGFSGMTRLAVGVWRSHAEPMQIVTPRVGGHDIVHYEAPPSSAVPAQMQQLVEWFNQSQGQLDGLVRAALVHLLFEAIHPFEDGNGRVGRALSDLALAQDFQSSLHLFSLSHQLLLHRSDYYSQLQAATGQPRLDVTAWVQWFVGRVQGACEHSVQQMHAAYEKTRYWSKVHAIHPAITSSQRKVLGKLLDAQAEGGFSGGLSTEKYGAITGLSRATAYRELAELLELGLLYKTGQGRATRYGLLMS